MSDIRVISNGGAVDTTFSIDFTNPATLLAGQLNWEWSERGLCEHIEVMMGAVAHYATSHAPVIIELGVRTGVSSAIWLAGIEKAERGRLWSVDIDEPSGSYVHQIIGHPAWTFHRGNDLDLAVLAPEDADILFVDTSHAYEHTLAELRLFTPKLQSEGVVFLHDSNVEDVGAGDEPWSVRRAIDTFIAEHPEWTVEHSADRFGLALMVRRP